MGNISKCFLPVGIWNPKAYFKSQSQSLLVQVNVIFLPYASLKMLITFIFFKLIDFKESYMQITITLLSIKFSLLKL